MHILIVAILGLGSVASNGFASYASASSLSCTAALITGSAPLVLASDEALITQFAREHRFHIELLAPNPMAFRYSRLSGYKAKPSELGDCKSLKTGPHAGLEACGPELFATREQWWQTRLKLTRLGFTVLGPDQNYLVRDHAGNLYFSDYDLLGVYDDQGQNVYSETLRRELNRLLGRELVMHGPLAQYQHRLDVGLKLPVRIFTYDADPVTLYDADELRRAQHDRHITWAW